MRTIRPARGEPRHAVGHRRSPARRRPRSVDPLFERPATGPDTVAQRVSSERDSSAGPEPRGAAPGRGVTPRDEACRRGTRAPTAESQVAPVTPPRGTGKSGRDGSLHFPAVPRSRRRVGDAPLIEPPIGLRSIERGVPDRVRAISDDRHVFACESRTMRGHRHRPLVDERPRACLLRVREGATVTRRSQVVSPAVGLHAEFRPTLDSCRPPHGDSHALGRIDHVLRQPRGGRPYVVFVPVGSGP